MDLDENESGMFRKLIFMSVDLNLDLVHLNVVYKGPLGLGGGLLMSV